MEAEEPQRGTATPISAVPEFIHPAALMRTNHVSVLGPQAQDGPAPTHVWAGGCGLPGAQHRDHASPCPRAVSEDGSSREDLVAEACDPAALLGSGLTPGPWARPGQRTPLVVVPISDLGSHELSLDLATLGIGQAGDEAGDEEDTSLPFAQLRLGPSCEERLAEAGQPRGSAHGWAGPGEGVPRSQGPGELLDPWEPREMQEQGQEQVWPQGEGVGPERPLGQPERRGEWLSGAEGARGPRQGPTGLSPTVLARQGEAELLMGQLGASEQGDSAGWRAWSLGEVEPGEQSSWSGEQSSWSGPGEGRGPAQRGAQSLVGGPERVSGEPGEQARTGMEGAVEEQEEGSWSEEEPEDGHGAWGTADRGEPGRPDLPPPGAPPPALEPVRWSWPVSSASPFPAGVSPGRDAAAWGSQAGGSERGRSAAPSPPGRLPVTPPRTPDSAASSPAVLSPCPSASASTAAPGREPSPAAVCAPETWGSLGAPPAPLLGVPPAEPTLDAPASAHWADGPGPAQHPRSYSFPGPCRPEPTPDLARAPLSSSHCELPQRPPSWGAEAPGRACSFPPAPPLSPPGLGQDSPDCTPNPGGPGGPPSRPHSAALAAGPPACTSAPRLVPTEASLHGPLPPPPLDRRPAQPPAPERAAHVATALPRLQRPHQPPPLALGPLPPPPDPLVARQFRPLPSTPQAPQLPRTSSYHKPLPPTPDLDWPPRSLSSSSIPRTRRPLPPVPIVALTSEPPPLPPKTRGRSQSTQGALGGAGAQPRPRPVCQEWTGPVPAVAGRTSWPPASAAGGRARSEAPTGLAFSNMTHLLGPESPTTPWTGEPGPPEEPKPPAGGSLRRAAPQESANGRRRAAGPDPEKPGHPHLEKASSWPHRREPGRARQGGGGPAAGPGEGSGRHKGWNRQGLRRPSILPEGPAGAEGPGAERFPGASNVVFREKKPKEVKVKRFSRRCSAIMNSSQLLYQEYSDVALNKEIQSQQRPDSISEVPGPPSPQQPPKTPPSDSHRQRLSMASSGSLWQEIPTVRGSAMLNSMTHGDQKLQEAKFELIVSEASYLRSLHIAVDHFQLSPQLRATISTQDHQWLFSRLQDVRDISTTFLSDLEDNFESNIFSFRVCDVVLNHAPNFRRVYLPYVTNQTYQERTFQKLLNVNSSFREVLEKLESDPVCQRLSLKSFLILPFQRITRLKLLLQNILKRTQPGSSEEAEATKAHHALEELIRDCNSSVHQMRRTEELIYLSQKIEFECKIFPLISQSRWLVKSGELMALEFSVSPGLRRKLNTRPIHLHLFNDCLLLSRPREGSRFLVFDHAPFASLRGEKCEMKLHGAHKNLFRLFLRDNAQGSQAEFLFSTETQSEKLRWISALALPREELDLLECYDSPQVQCLRAYKPRENDELALEKADVVMVTQQSNDGWLEGVRLSDGERGWFPLQQVEFISNPEVCARNLKEAQRVKTAKLQLVEQQT